MRWRAFRSSRSMSCDNLWPGALRDWGIPRLDYGGDLACFHLRYRAGSQSSFAANGFAISARSSRRLQDGLTRSHRHRPWTTKRHSGACRSGCRRTPITVLHGDPQSANHLSCPTASMVSLTGIVRAFVVAHVGYALIAALPP